MYRNLFSAIQGCSGFVISQTGVTLYKVRKTSFCCAAILNTQISSDRPLRRDKLPSRKWSETKTSKVLSSDAAASMGLKQRRLLGYFSCALENQDKCSLGNFIIWRDSKGTLSIGKVLELLQIVGSPSELQRCPDIVLICIYATQANSFCLYGDTSTPKMSSAMPKLISTHNEAVINFTVCIAFD